MKDPKEKFPLISLDRFLSSVKMANREQKNIVHDEENPVNWGKEEVDSWLQLQWPQLGKGSHPKPIVQFFLTLFKRPFTSPPPSLVLNMYVANFLNDYIYKSLKGRD